jgi:nitrile hydratase beta subunit
MRRPHDVGGLEGFGPIVPDQGEYVPFHEEWERRVFGMTMCVIGKGLVRSVDEFRWGIEQSTPEQYFAQTYFERWTAPIERALFNAGRLGPGEVARKAREIAAGAPVPRHDEPQFAEAFVQFCLTTGGFGQPADLASARFRPGDRIRVKDVEAPAHTRLPTYARGKAGMIERIQERSLLPDLRATRNGEVWEHTYMVVFDACVVFGDRAEPGQELTLDVWESYIEPLEA